jgi:hypothetical protein
LPRDDLILSITFLIFNLLRQDQDEEGKKIQGKIQGKKRSMGNIRKLSEDWGRGRKLSEE